MGRRLPTRGPVFTQAGPAGDKNTHRETERQKETDDNREIERQRVGKMESDRDREMETDNNREINRNGETEMERWRQRQTDRDRQ